MSYLNVISPIDGRYNSTTIRLRKIFSEYEFIKIRVKIELYWIIKLSENKLIKEIDHFDSKTIKILNRIYKNFNLNDAKRIKEIEKITRHDVKSIEYFLKEKFSNHVKLNKIKEFIHFACTSEDINNIAYALMIKKTKETIIIPFWKEIIKHLKSIALKYSNISMLSRTHGQPATPSTIGKEFINFIYRMNHQLNILSKIKILGKINGSVGNYNAHYIAYPKINWIKISEEFIKSLGIYNNFCTTQIEPHDYIAELFDCISRFNTVLININRDIWGYISLNYFKQKILNSLEIGSSVMPHKVNPINFENSEGNLGLSNALMKHMTEKLPISRWQRDLSDSTVMRNIGVAFSYSVIAYDSFINGINKIDINIEKIKSDLDSQWILLAEPIQTIMRKYNILNSYEKLKKLTRGKEITQENIIKFIDSLSIPEKEKKILRLLSPSKYIGQSKEIVNKFL
ncbi:adenylosuccinate lyase [Buchnera aphidicola (Neophyllaphis varicolor)]|uniref:adenylosuccinate lyase n=1 Tax=Buchnera aphidicola TaxID=9 RepID=UPI0031B85900